MNNNAKKETEKKIVNNGFVFGGVIGFLIGGFLCIVLGIPEGMFWLAFVPALIGGIIGTNKAAKTASQKAEKKIAAQKQAQDKFVAEYKAVVRHLPKDQMNRLGNTLAHIIRCLKAEEFEDRDLPIELCKMSTVAITFMNNCQYGTLTPAQSSSVNKVLDEFEESIQYTLPAIHMNLDDAASRGLGFGIIGSSVDVALHSVMDTTERIKNIKTSVRATGNLIDKMVKELLENLRVIITK